MLFKNKHNWKTPRKQYSSEFPGLIFASTIPDSELKESEKPEIPMGAHKTTKRTTVKACSPGKKQAAQQQKTFTEKKKKNNQILQKETGSTPTIAGRLNGDLSGPPSPGYREASSSTPAESMENKWRTWTSTPTR